MRIRETERFFVRARSGSSLSGRTQAQMEALQQQMQHQGRIILKSEIEGPTHVHGKWQNEIIIHWEADTEDPLYRRSLRSGAQPSRSSHLLPALGIAILLVLVACIITLKLQSPG